MLTAVLVNVNRDPKKGEAAKPSDFFYFDARNDGPKIPTTCADTFFSLVNDEKMIGWVLNIAPLDRLRASRGSGAGIYPRAWVGGRVMMLNPKIVNGKVTAPLAIVDECRFDLPTTLVDVDSGQQATILLPQGLQRYVIDAEFDLTD
jgi:hypothetical protein